MKQAIIALVIASLAYWAAHTIKHARAHDVPGHTYHGWVTARP